MREHVTTLGRNYLLSLTGEGLQSGFHFVLNLVLIRALTAYDYGLFGIIFVLGGIALTYGNALASIPASVHMPKLKNVSAVRLQEVIFGSVAVAVSAIFAVGIAIVLGFATGQAFEAMAGGAFVGTWTLRNHLRAVLFARRNASAVTFSDLSYSVSGIGSIALLLWLESGAPRVAPVLAMLTAANMISIGVALMGLASPVRVSFGRNVRRRYVAIWHEIKWSLIGVTTWTIQGQAPMFLVAAIVGPAAYAPIAAALVIFSPLRPAVAAFINIVRPELSAGLATGRHGHIWIALWTSFGGAILFCVCFDLAVWLGWGFLDAHIFGDKFANVSMPLIVILAGVVTLFAQSYHTPFALIQAARQFKSVALATTLGGFVGLCATAVMLYVAGVAWSLAGLAAGEIACWIYLWVAALRILLTQPGDTPNVTPQPRHAAMASPTSRV